MTPQGSARWRVGVVTTSRADFGIYRPVLASLAGDPDIDLGLYVSGMHVSPEFGLTETIVADSGYAVWDRVEMLLSSDTEEGIAKSMGLGTLSFASSFARTRPDLVIVLGDRFEMHAAGLAALPFRVPLAHIHGGEETEGAIDNALRHSLTKLSHLHFVSTQLAAARLRAMGEAPDRITVSGAPSLDQVASFERLPRAMLAERFGIPAEGDFLIATYHPVTLAPEHSLDELNALWSVLKQAGHRVVFTLSNADTAGRTINARLEAIAAESDRVSLVGTMGVQGYFSTMAEAAVMIGNSSSGILEAASFGLPVVNIGDRQRGRERSANTIDCAADPDAIRAALERALSDSVRDTARQARNVYGQGKAGPAIHGGIRGFLEAGAPVDKHFHMAGRPA